MIGSMSFQQLKTPEESNLGVASKNRTLWKYRQKLTLCTFHLRPLKHSLLKCSFQLFLQLRRRQRGVDRDHLEGLRRVLGLQESRKPVKASKF